jgi:MFS family permease
VREALNLHTLLTGAVVVTAIQIGSITASIAGQKLPERTAIVTALVVLGLGVWMLIVAVPLHLYLLVGLSALIVGTGGGLSYMVGLNIVGRIAPPDRRAETLSAYLVVCYTGYSVPSLAVGIAATWFGLFASFFGAAVLLGMIAVALLVLTTEKNLQAGPLPQQR